MLRQVAAVFGMIGLASFGAAMSAGAAAAADYVILESNVASLTPGSVIPGAQAVSLDGGAKVVMIAADGTTRAVKGPYSGTLDKAGSDAPGALERMTAGRNDSNHVVGAIRAPKWND